MSTTPIWKDVFVAALSNDIDSVKYFIEEKGDPATIRDQEQKTVAHIAAEFGRFSVLKYILDKNATLLEASDVHGYTVLHRAVEFGDLKVVKYLVDERGADIYRPSLQPPGNTPIHVAAQKNRFDVFEYFVREKHIDVNLRNRLGEPPLFSAAEKPYMRIIQYLIEKCNADVRLLDVNQNNILFKSAKRGDTMLVKYLFNKRNLTFDLNWRDVDGFTALNLASKNNKVGLVNFLIHKDANISIPDSLKRTPLHHAAAGGFFHLSKLLVEFGASYETEDINGITPRDLAHDPKVRKFFFLNTLKERNTADRTRTRRSVPGLVSSDMYPPVAPNRSNFMPKLLMGNEFYNGGIDLDLAFNSFLLVTNTLLKRMKCYSTDYAGTRLSSLLSPSELVQRQINPVAIDAVENSFNMEDQ